MKMRVAAAVAVIVALGSTALAAPASANRACRKVSGGVPASLLEGVYQTGNIKIDRQRGSSVCDGMDGGLYCVIVDPGLFSVSSGGDAVTFKAPLLAKVRIWVVGEKITCQII